MACRNRFQLPGDLVLADRGFDVHRQCGLRGAYLQTPAFKGKGRNQLTCKETQESRKISNVRIHVERVIDQLRNKYKILKGPLSVHN